MIVAAKLKFVPILKLVELSVVSITITITAIITGATGIRLPAYVPRAIAEIAIGAAKPIVIETKPDKNPKAGWKILDRNIYSPPDFGILAASSPYVSAPQKATKPPVIQINTSANTEWTPAACKPRLVYTPVPIIFEITIVVARTGLISVPLSKEFYFKGDKCNKQKETLKRNLYGV
jgi:hypothetical protein